MIYDMLLEKLTNQALALLRQVLQLVLHVRTIARIAMLPMSITLNVLSPATSSASSMPFTTALATRTALNEVVDITTAPPTLSAPHEGPTMTPAHTHKPCLPALPAGLCISSVENAPDLRTSGAVNEHKVAVPGAIRWAIVVTSLE